MVQKLKKEVISKKSSGNSYGYSNADKQAFLDDIKKHGKLLSETAISATFDILTIFEKISELYNAKLEYFKSERANRFLANIKDIDNKWIISEYSTGEIWVARQDTEECSDVMAYTRRVLNRLIDEKLFNKTEKNLSATQWTVMLTSSKKDAFKDKQIARFIEILNEEIK